MVRRLWVGTYLVQEKNGFPWNIVVDYMYVQLINVN